MAIVVRGQENRETCNGNCNWNQREEEAVPQTVREEGDDHRETEGSGPGRDGMQLRSKSSESVFHLHITKSILRLTVLGCIHMFL